MRIKTIIDRADRLSDHARLRIGKIGGFKNRLTILPYLGYGTADKFFVSGRVLQDEGLRPATSADRTWRNLINTYRRLETDEVPRARIRARFKDVDVETIADQEGYFHFEIHPVEAPAADLWQDVDLELLEPSSQDAPLVRATARVLVPSPTAKIGIISDVDDTILSTHVTNKLKMLLTIVLSNEHTRKPFGGVAAFYRALQGGASGSSANPIFYVSNSPWNFYTLLVEFMNVQKIPLGPLLLRDFGYHLLFSAEHQSHKRKNIQLLLQTFPHLPFVLIGDSGEQDPEIYRDVVKEWPDRIRVIYIRSVNRSAARLAAIDKLIEEVRQTRGQLVLAPDSEFAAAHAAAEGLISTRELAAIRSETNNDKSA